MASASRVGRVEQVGALEPLPVAVGALGQRARASRSRGRSRRRRRKPSRVRALRFARRTRGSPAPEGSLRSEQTRFARLAAILTSMARSSKQFAPGCTEIAINARTAPNRIAARCDPFSQQPRSMPPASGSSSCLRPLLAPGVHRSLPHRVSARAGGPGRPRRLGAFSARRLGPLARHHDRGDRAASPDP